MQCAHDCLTGHIEGFSVLHDYCTGHIAGCSATLIVLVSSLLLYHYSTRSQSAPASAITSTVFAGADR